MKFNPYQEILSEIQTKEEARELSFLIDTLLADIYKTNKKAVEKDLEKSLSQKIYQKIIKTMGTDYTLSDVKQFLTELKENLQKLKILNLTLAIQPTAALIKEISLWIKENLGEGIILGIEKDKDIMGGAIISFEGSYKDYSLRKVYEEKINQSKLISLLNNNLS